MFRSTTTSNGMSPIHLGSQEGGIVMFLSTTTIV
jgi:hypothetical protein